MKKYENRQSSSGSGSVRDPCINKKHCICLTMIKITLTMCLILVKEVNGPAWSVRHTRKPENLCYLVIQSSSHVRRE